jgi:RNA polymerase sigma-70 factor (ECF subfamily)
MRHPFEQIFKQFFSPLCNYAAKYTGDEAVAEDIVQALFISLWETGKYREIKEPERFLLRAVKYRCIDHLRGRKQETELLPEDIASTLPFEMSELKEEEIEPMFYYFASKLPEKTREIFLLSKQAGLTYRQIAEELSISVKTVENQMGRALRILRDLLKKDHDPGKRNFLLSLLL